jgi:hypothetical protein
MDRIALRRPHARAPPFTAATLIRPAPMNLFVSIGPVISLIAGILILIIPRLLNYIVAIYLILVGLIGLLGPHIR